MPLGGHVVVGDSTTNAHRDLIISRGSASSASGTPFSSPPAVSCRTRSTG
jgi:hypothetical protein